MDTPNNFKRGNPYRVPEGYFAELRNNLRERVTVEAQIQPTVWQRIKGIVGLSAAFGCLVLFATIGYYFTGYKAQQREQVALQTETSEMMLGYRLYADDIVALEEYVNRDSVTRAQNQALFIQDVADYFDTYGYNGDDLLAALTEIDIDW